MTNYSRRGLREILSRAWNQDSTSWCSDWSVCGRNWSNPAIIFAIEGADIIEWCEVTWQKKGCGYLWQV